jgi:hypothetical protein
MEKKIHCPICHAHYDVEEDVVGQTVTCECGQDFVATAESKSTKTIALGSKLCPGCEGIVAVDSVICVDCGYNFKTKTNMSIESVDDEPEIEVDAGPGLGAKLMPLIKPVAILLILGIIAWFVYAAMTTKHFGITEDKPLGTFEELDKHFTNVGLVKRSKPILLPKAFGVTGKIYYYDNQKMSRETNGALSENVFVIVDAANNVCGVGGSFTPASKSIPGGLGGKVKGFITTYWNETGCVKDESATKTVTHKGLTASLTWHENINESNNGIVHGHWSEASSNGTGLTEGENNVLVIGAKYSGDAILLGGASSNADDIKSMVKIK